VRNYFKLEAIQMVRLGARVTAQEFAAVIADLADVLVTHLALLITVGLLLLWGDVLNGGSCTFSCVLTSWNP
jgi:hypothetical protein